MFNVPHLGTKKVCSSEIPIDRPDLYLIRTVITPFFENDFEQTRAYFLFRKVEN